MWSADLCSHWQHKHDLPAAVWLQTRVDSDGGGGPLHRGSEEADGVQEQRCPGGRLWCHNPGCCVQGAEAGSMFAHTLTHTHTILVSSLPSFLPNSSPPSLSPGPMGSRRRSVGAPVLPTFWSSPLTLKPTWLWMVVWPGSCSQTTGSATWTLTTCTACPPPWWVCVRCVWCGWTASAGRRIKRMVYMKMQLFWTMNRNISVFIFACTDHDIRLWPHRITHLWLWSQKRCPRTTSTSSLPSPTLWFLCTRSDLSSGPAQDVQPHVWFRLWFL